jgi:sec-independent protein translocase protein TatB
VFDIGGLELLVIAVVALVVIGPKELPATLRTIAFWVRKARAMAREFHSGFEELTREAELDELRREVNAAIEKDPLDEAAHGMRDSVEHTIGPETYSDLDSAYPGSPVEEPAPETGPAPSAAPAPESVPEPAPAQDNAEAPPPRKDATGG